jgi:hypothetical protein
MNSYSIGIIIPFQMSISQIKRGLRESSIVVIILTIQNIYIFTNSFSTQTLTNYLSYSIFFLKKYYFSMYFFFSMSHNNFIFLFFLDSEKLRRTIGAKPQFNSHQYSTSRLPQNPVHIRKQIGERNPKSR